MTEQQEKTPVRRKKRPTRLSGNWMGGVLPTAGHALTMLLAAILLGMLMSGAVSSEMSVIRILITLAMTALILLLFFQEGLRIGTRDAVVSNRVRRMEKESLPVSAQEDRACWHPMKAAAALVIVFIIPLLLAAYIAIVTEPYTYSLQDLPEWVSSESVREDILAPLEAYKEPTAVTPRVLIRMGVRLMEMPIIGFVRDPLRMGQMIDRAAPAVILLYAVMFFAGYLLGPGQASRIAARERRAKKAAVRKAERSTLADELTRGGGEVHYGQRNERRGSERKKLI